MRQIFPVQVDPDLGALPGSGGEPSGQGGVLDASGQLRDGIKPAAAGAPGVSELISWLAGIYACPDRRWVRANMVASVDGAVSVHGRSGGLSGAADHLVFFLLRSLADVILVGAGTARAENYGRAKVTDVWPQLRSGLPATPPIAVVSRHLNLDLNGRLLGGSAPEGGCEGAARPILLTTRLAPADRREMAARTAEVVVAGDRDVNVDEAIGELWSRGYRRILVEGGPMLLGELSAAGMLDELCLTISPLLEGGRAGRIISEAKPVTVTGLRLRMLLEDSGYLLSSYLLRDQD